MDGFSGYAVYRRFTAGSRKGVRNSDGTFDGNRMNVGSGTAMYADANGDSYFRYGERGAVSRSILRGTLENGTPQSEYTSRKVEFKGTATDGKIVLRWTPVLPGSIILKSGTTYYQDDGNGGLIPYANATLEKAWVNGQLVVSFVDSQGAAVTPGATLSDAVKYGNVRDVHTGDIVAGAVTGTVGFFGEVTVSGMTDFEIEYDYQNDYIPQNDIPTINVEQEGIELRAKPRRIQIVFSQFAEFVGQKDYNFDINKELQKQAEFQIQLEIDNEVVETAIGLGKSNAVAATWYAGAPIGISLYDHYETLADALAVADAKIFQSTNKFTGGNYILISPMSARYFSMNRNYKPLNSQRFGVGAYVAGEILNHKVIVSNMVDDDAIYVGVNTADASAIILGMYMPIMSTQMLGLPDGTMAQGFASLYDCKVINPALVVKVAIAAGAAPATIEVVDGE